MGGRVSVLTVLFIAVSVESQLVVSAAIVTFIVIAASLSIKE